MANYATLKASVNAYIKANGVRAITGPVLNGVLTQMINTLGDGARFAGVATPAGNPGTVDNVVFYLAFTAGTYTNYGGVTLDGSTLHVFVYDGTWDDIDLGAPTSLAMTAYAKIDGYYQSLVAGAAENLVGHGTIPAEFIFRTSGGSMDIGTGAAGIKSIKGKSLVWNQLFEKSSATYSLGKVWNNVGGLAERTNGVAIGPMTMVAGHKYIIFSSLYARRIQGYATNMGSTPNDYYLNTGTDQPHAVVFTAGANDTSLLLSLQVEQGDSGTMDSDAWSAATINIVDLTRLFNGSVPENYSVAEFQEDYPMPYYAYNPGTLISNDAESMETVGFNLFDPETGKAQLLGGQSDGYQITGAYSALSFTGVGGETSTITPDANGKFNVTENGELTVTGGNATDTCVHLVWSGYRNGEYEPYDLHTAALGLNALSVTDGTNIITVNGLKSAGSVYDEIDPVRKKYIKRIGEVDLGTLTFSYSTVYNGFYTSKDIFAQNLEGKVICSKYPSVNGVTNLVDKSLTGFNVYQRVYIRDTSFDGTTPEGIAAFKTAMSGVPLYFELATPVEYDLVDDIPASYYVNDFGTERAVAPEGATLPSAPFSEEVRYAMNAVDQLRRMPEQYVSKDSLENLLEALKTAGLISAYTMTWNSTTQEYGFTVTAPVEPTPEP